MYTQYNKTIYEITYVGPGNSVLLVQESGRPYTQVLVLPNKDDIVCIGNMFYNVLNITHVFDPIRNTDNDGIKVIFVNIIITLGETS